MELTVDFLEGELLCLADEAEDHEPSDEIQTSVEAEGTGRCHDGLHARESQGQDTGYDGVSAALSCRQEYTLTKGVVDAHSPGHTLLTLNGGEHLSGILECHGAFAKGIADRE